MKRNEPRRLSVAEDIPLPEAEPCPYALQDQVGHLLRRAYQRHVSIFQQTASDPQITSVQFAVLVAIGDHGPASLARIAAATAIDHATLRGIVLRLATRDVIEFGDDPADRRARQVSLSAIGRLLLARLIPDGIRITAQTLEPLDAEERKTMIKLLKKIAAV